MRYEPILLTDEEDELTDYSASEDEMMNTSIDQPPFPSQVSVYTCTVNIFSNCFICSPTISILILYECVSKPLCVLVCICIHVCACVSKNTVFSNIFLNCTLVLFPQQPTPVPVSHPVATIKSTGTPSSVTSSTTAMKPNELTKHGIAKAAAIINSVSEATVSKALKAGTKRQAKGKVSNVAVTKIAKTVARTRDSQPTQRSQVTIKQENSVPKASSLVISFPLKLAMSSSAPSVSTHTIETKLNKAQSPVAVQNQGNMQVKTVISRTLPPPPLTVQSTTSTTTSAGGSVVSSSSTGSSSSSSSSDSEDSGSESSTSSPDEAMETGGPVPIISTAKNADQLPRPKAILSPVKVTPPTIITNMATPPPLLSPLTSPGMGTQMSFPWNNPRGEIKPPSSGLMPIAPSLSSPPSTLPFSSLNKPGSTNSAFQIVSPRLYSQSSAPLQDSTSSIAANNNNSTESSSTV